MSITTNFALCFSEPQLGGEPNVLLITKIKPDVDLLVDVINTFTNKYPNDEFDIPVDMRRAAWVLGYIIR